MKQVHNLKNHNMTDSAKVQVTKLNDENYQVWKYKMELLLIKEDLWTVINDEGRCCIGGI